MDGEDWVGDRWSGDDFGVYRYVTEKAERKLWRLKMRLSEPGTFERIPRTSWTGPDPQSSGTSHSKSTERSVFDVTGAGYEWGEQPGVQMHTEATGV